MRESSRYLGLELAGAKNLKTAVAVLEFYPRERKIFLLDIFDRIVPREAQSPDEALLELIQELKPGIAKVGVNVPLELPPCISCTRKTCPLPSHCTVPSVKWMRDFTKKLSTSHHESKRVLEFTPYTQRPFELWARYQILPALATQADFEIDETLGGNRAPLTARLNFLKRHITDVNLIEIWPKLSVAILTRHLKLETHAVAHYRKLENGVHYREEILSQIAKKQEIFIYERDLHKLAQSLPAFDAFFCAYTALLSNQERCAQPPRNFPLPSGWVHYPKP